VTRTAEKTKSQFFKVKRTQIGATLIELLIGLALSMIVTGSMVLLMANSLGTTTRVIEMSQLTDELRNTMSMLSRDIRRANHNPYALYCYADPDCGTNGASPKFRFLEPIVVAGGSSCVIFNLEREFYVDPAAVAFGGGGFRLVDSGDTDLGDSIEVWTGATAPPSNCGGTSGAGGWQPVTDPEFVNITEFVIDTGGSLGQSIKRKDGSVMLSTETCEVRVSITGTLLKDQRLAPEQRVVKSIQDVIRVRNDYLSDPDNPPDTLLCS
jgi:hypothetical protein